MPDLSPLVEGVGSLVGPAVKALLKTTAGAILLTALTAVGCVLIAARGSWVRGLLGAAVAIALGVIVGGVLALKRVVLAALSHGLTRLGLGKRTVGAVFRRIVDVQDDEAWKERGSATVQRVERLPLAQAEHRLRDALAAVTGETASVRGLRGWLLRRVEGTLLGYIEMLTLASFRESDAREGGVDVLRVRDELAQKVDGAVSGMIDKVALKFTALLTLGALVAALAGAFAIRVAEL